MLAVGFVLAAFSAFFNGTFGVFSKLPKVRAAQVPPQIYNFWFALGVCCLSAIITPFTGKVSLGVALATGLWSGVAIVVSFTFGVTLVGDKIGSVLLAVVGLVLLLAGVVLVAWAGVAGDASRQPSNSPRLMSPASEEAPGLCAAPGGCSEEVRQGKGSRAGRPPLDSVLVGVACATATGFLGGSLLVPMHFAPPSAQGLSFLPSFSIGIAVAVLPVTLLLNGILAASYWVPLQSTAAALPGCFSGCAWNAGNICSILAVSHLGLAVAYPIFQCGLFVAGLWGVLLFGEIRGLWQILYWVAGGFIVGGAAMLAISSFG